MQLCKCVCVGLTCDCVWLCMGGCGCVYLLYSLCRIRNVSLYLAAAGDLFSVCVRLVCVHAKSIWCVCVYVCVDAQKEIQGQTNSTLY